MEFRFTLIGEIVPQARPRISTRSGLPKAYDSEKSRDFKEYVSHMAYQSMDGHEPFSGPIVVSICVYRRVPSTWSKLKVARALDNMIFPTGRPDVDNLAKGIMDGMTGVVWVDDAQVVRLIVEKKYDNQDWASVRVLFIQEDR